jgi:hypothetical protein
LTSKPRPELDQGGLAKRSWHPGRGVGVPPGGPTKFCDLSLVGPEHRFLSYESPIEVIRIAKHWERKIWVGKSAQFLSGGVVYGCNAAQSLQVYGKRKRNYQN